MSAGTSADNVLSTKTFMTLSIRRMFVIVFALLMFFALLPMQAQAASLTPTQLQAVVSLLRSFDVDSETVGAIEAQLQGRVQYSEDDIRKVESPRPPKPPKPSMPAGVIQNNFPGASACAQLMRNLKKGDQGEEVARLQAYLRQEGDFDHSSTTGFFGEKTEQALKRWQERMQIVREGNASTTGFGALGPRTREMLMKACKEKIGVGAGTNVGEQNASSTKPTIENNFAGMKPMCVLKASKTKIALGESVTLKWESKYATYASTMSGDKGLPYGAITLTPTETTTYLKRVYNATSEGECTVMVEVGSTTPAAAPKVVIVPTKINVGHLFNLMGLGAASVMEGYLSLFNFSLE